MSDTKPLTICVERARAGDATSFDGLVAQFQSYAVGYAFTLTGNWAWAEDVAQEAFLAAWLEIDTLHHAAAFPGWLRQIVFKYADRARRGHRPTVPLDVASDAIAPGVDPATFVLRREQRDAVCQALGSLSHAERTAVTLFYQGGHTQVEIAAFLGVSVPAVKKRLERGRARLRGEFITMSLVESVMHNDSVETTRFVEVNRLLRDLTTQLEADPQVAAAYLVRWGDDEGLGASNDAWASLNLHVVVRDEYLDHFAAGRLSYVRRVREPLLWVEAAQNAPPSGYYLMSLYDGDAGPYEVNWYWKPLSDNATIPEQALLLINKANLPAGPPVVWSETAPTPPLALQVLWNAQSETERKQEILRNHISLFWAMWFISARYIIRNPNEERMGFVKMLRNLLHSTRQEIGPVVAETQNGDAEEARQPNAQAKINLLQALAIEMEELHSQALAAGATVPVVIVPRAHRFLRSVAAVVVDAV